MRTLPLIALIALSSGAAHHSRGADRVRGLCLYTTLGDRLFATVAPSSCYFFKWNETRHGTS